MAAKKETAKKEETELQTVDWSQDLGAGFENVDQSDLGIPFLSIIQKLSPEVDEESPKYIEGVKPGDILLGTNKKVYGNKADMYALFVPCGYQKAYVEWAPRESGGGYIGTHGMAILNECRKDDRGRDVLQNGNLVVTTSYVMGYLFDEDDGEWYQAVIALTSTQLKKARQWLNLMNSKKLEKDGKKLPLPMYSHKYRLSTQPESNEQGSWFGWKIETDSMVNEPQLVATAREEHQKLLGGSMKMLAPPSEVTPF